MSSDSNEKIRKRPRVVIVGGGLAGMSAAESLARCSQGNLDIEVIEAKRNIGGRAGSFHERSSRETVDYCQHVAMGCCTNFIGLLNRCGQLDQWDRYSDLEFRFAGKQATQFQPSRILPAPFHLLGSLLGIRYLKRKQILSIVLAMWRLMRTSPAQLQNVTAKEWLVRNGQDKVVRERFWDVILISALAESAELVSMVAARKVIIDGFAAAHGAADILIPRRPLSVLFGIRLTEEVRKLGVAIRTDSTVRKINRTENERVEIQLNNSETLLAEHVIVATHWNTGVKLLADHLPHSTVEQFRKINSSPISGVHLWFDRDFTDRPHTVFVGGLSQWLFRPQRNMDSKNHDFYYQVVISASADLRGTSKEEIVRKVVSEIEQFFPEAKNSTLLRSRVVTDPNSVFSLTPEAERIRPDSSTSQDWLHLAGDWINTGWPATMEGAVVSGRMAANSVLKKLAFDPIDIDQGLRNGLLTRILIKS